MTSTIAVKHNIEIAHRLFESKGKCENIHGHSMWVTMELTGRVNDQGMLGGIDYGPLKHIFRRHLDSEYDHRLLLNATDPFAKPLFVLNADDSSGGPTGKQIFLPGLNAAAGGDPTTENLSLWIMNAMEDALLVRNMVKDICKIEVQVWETSVNYASSSREMPYGRTYEGDPDEGQ